jgi:hypothetical protein
VSKLEEKMTVEDKAFKEFMSQDYGAIPYYCEELINKIKTLKVWISRIRRNKNEIMQMYYWRQAASQWKQVVDHYQNLHEDVDANFRRAYWDIPAESESSETEEF